VSLLLAADEVALYPPGGADPHGWALPGAAPSWRGRGSWQPGPGASDPGAADRGGHGPQGPATVALGQLFLPPEAPVADGVVALVGGRRYALSQTRLVRDPRGTGDLDCWAASCAEAVA
jgi:hypothetical protein